MTIRWLNRAVFLLATVFAAGAPILGASISASSSFLSFGATNVGQQSPLQTVTVTFGPIAVAAVPITISNSAMLDRYT
ncbi:MAG TPA: hypothetical protein VGL97_14915 [Bryobacteraceae bacterium]